MAPLELEGETLGQRHHSYNKIATIKSGQKNTADINYEDSDLDNLLKIDIASKNKDVEYILKIFQSEDMLYVSRAIKQSTWLITEPQYEYIINPKYIYEHFHPNMTAKGFNKLMLHIRLNLKNELTAEKFFEYYEERDIQLALKWLPLCSNSFREQMISKHAEEIPSHMIKRLCENSIQCIENCINSLKSYNKYSAMKSTNCFLKKYLENYLTIVESCAIRYVPRFGSKQTKLIMTKCFERVMSNLGLYSNILHVPTFVKFIKKEDMKDFILKHINNQDLRSFFDLSNVDPFIKRLPEEGRFEFVKETFIDKKRTDIDEDVIYYRFGFPRGTQSTSQNIYYWYKYAPFQTAFVDLKKLIRAESHPNERTTMFGIILSCAGKDMKNISSLIKYYRENHINEPFKFKIQFVNLVLSKTDTHRFDKETWGYLHDLFSSMEVYSESDNMVQFCVQSIILRSIINDETIPDIIQQKFLFDTFESYQNKLTEEEKEKVFLYWYTLFTSKIEKLDINKDKEFDEMVYLLKTMFDLFITWDKELEDFPAILDKLKALVYLKEKNKRNVDLTRLFDMKKSWRKLLFQESILISPTQETCINALKHGPKLLEQYKNNVEAICLDDNARKIQFLKKLRIYWTQSWANTYKELFLNKLDQKNAHKSAMIGLCTLLPHNEITNLVEKYAPTENKIDWSDPDNLELSIRKHLAMNMLLARPKLSVTAALLYAKGDYLRFVLPSLKSILHNISSANIRLHLPKLLNSPVSLQKHGIRVAFAKLRYDELKDIFSEIWKSAKNSSIRADIFNQTQNFLCEEKDEAVIIEMWQLLSIFIDNLTPEENKLVFTKLSKVEKVPMLVRAEYWMKSYKFLKSLPLQANCEGLVAHLISNMQDIMHLLDNQFVADIFMESFEEKLSTETYEHSNLLPMFLLSTKTEAQHIDRNKKVLTPLLDRSIEMWNKTHNNSYFVRFNLQEILSNLDDHFERIVLNQKMFLPIPLYEETFERLNESLSIVEEYITITNRKLALECVKSFERVLNSNEALKKERASSEPADCSQWGPLYEESAPEFGKICYDLLKDDIAKHFPSIYVLFAEPFVSISSSFGFNRCYKMMVLKSILESDNAIPYYIFVMKAFSLNRYEKNELQIENEILDNISKHTSEEVKIHYWLLKNKLNRENS